MMPEEPQLSQKKAIWKCSKFFYPELRNNASVENGYFPKPVVIFLGAVHKGRPHKIAKN